MTDSEQIKLLKKGDKYILKRLYLDNKSSFIKYAQKFNLPSEDILDIYQDAIIILFNNAVKGKLDNLKCSLKTYQFSIGKNLIYETIRKNNKTQDAENVLFKDEFDFCLDEDFTIKKTNQQQLLTEAIGKLGKVCQEILKLFYYNGYTLDEIKEKLKYQSKDVVKSQKSRCISKLKKTIKNG